MTPAEHGVPARHPRPTGTPCSAGVMPFDQSLVPWIIAAVLLVALVVVAVVLRARARRAVAAAKAAADEQARAAREQHEALAAAHDDALAQAAADHARERDALGAERQAALTEAKQARDLVAAGLKWEATSRDDIADACRQLGVDAVLLTNVVFVPVATSASSRFVAQVDHVLLGETGVMVIENKGWNGIVFDGLTPSSVFPAFAGLFDESTMTPPFALQVVKDSPTVLTVRTHLGRDAPASRCVVRRSGCPTGCRPRPASGSGSTPACSTRTATRRSSRPSATPPTEARPRRSSRTGPSSRASSVN
jgi:hypothetical protein